MLLLVTLLFASAQPVAAQTSGSGGGEPAALQLNTLDAGRPMTTTGEAHLLNTEAAPRVPPFAPGEVLVGLAPSATAAAGVTPTAVWQGMNVTQVEPLDLRGVEGVEGYQLGVDAGSEWQVVEALRQSPDVVFAELDWLARTAQAPPTDGTRATTDAQAAAAVPAAVALPSEAAAVEQPLHLADSLYVEQWYLQRIGLARALNGAFNDAGQGLRTIEVAVIDTGVDFNHPDLAERLLPGQNYLSPGTPPSDDNGHGTHISGLIAAAGNDAGMVAAGWRVELLPMKVLDSEGFGAISYIAQAIRDAADSGVDIINLSLQITNDSFVLRSAIDYAVDQGVLVIAAAGNCTAAQCPVPVRYPAAYANVLGIAATTYYDAHAYYSAVGEEIDMAAPGGGSGTSMTSSWSRMAASRCPSRLREVDGGLYCNADGTSMAAAVATGAAALAWSVDPSLSAGAVRAILEETAVPVSGSGNEVGEGRLDVAAAVRYAIRPQVQLDTTQLQVSSPEGGDPLVETLTLRNPSLTPASWVITGAHTTDWFGLQSADSGSVAYGQSVQVQVVFTPTHMGVGSHLGAFWVQSARAGGGETRVPVYVRLDVFTRTTGNRVLLPLVEGNRDGLTWAKPGYSIRTAYAMPSNGSIRVDLPFTFTVAGRDYQDIRIHADGYAIFPAASFASGLPNTCLANRVTPDFAIYGWWADLDPSTEGNHVSTFQPDADTFVIEYRDVVSSGATPAYTVSFQIMLHRGGEIALNYRDVPDATTVQSVTVGVFAADGRFYNEIACHRPTYQAGGLPESHQTLRIRPEDLF